MKSSLPFSPVSLQAAALGAVLGLASSASAQEPSKADLARARTAFQEGVALAAANNCAAALVKYREVAQVKMTPQVAFNTAECEARLGKLVSALGDYRVAASQAANDKRAAAVLKEAPARVEDLEARIPKLTVTRGKGADTAVIELDGTELGQTQLGNAIPVDPGAHTIVAKVSGKEYLHETVKLDEKQTKTFDVKISVAAPVVEPPAPDQPTEPQPKPQEKSRVPGIAVTVVGGAIMIVGFAMLAPRQSAISQLQRDCNTANQCPASDQSVASQGKLFTGVSEVMVPVGLVTAITGIVLIAKAGPSKPKSDTTEDKDKDKDKKEEVDKKDAFWRSIQVVPGAPGANIGGLGLTGRF
jgi:hypothetical protein